MGHPGAVLTPLVLGPHDVPVVRDESVARADPELAVLSAIAHGKTDAAEAVARAAFIAVRSLDEERAAVYSDVVMLSLRATARTLFEDLMDLGTYVYRRPCVKRHIAMATAVAQADGKAEGKALSILAVLEARGVRVSSTGRSHVLACADTTKLDRWLARAVTAATAKNVIAE